MQGLRRLGQGGLARHPLLRGDGQIREWVGTTIDVTTRHREEEALRILSGGAAELSNTLDYQATLRAVGEMAIPTFADICIVDLMDDWGSSAGWRWPDGWRTTSSRASAACLQGRIRTLR